MPHLHAKDLQYTFCCHMGFCAVPILVMFPTFCDFHNFIEVIPIEAMESVKEPSSQESQPPAVPEAALPSTTISTPPTTETDTAEEL